MRRDINGLLVVGITLGIALGVSGLVARHQQAERLDRIHDEGTALANSLSRISLERLAPVDRDLGPLTMIRASMPHSDLAYGLIVRGGVGEPGRIVASVGERELAPVFSLSTDPADWSGQRIETVPGVGDFYEFTAPILEAGRLVGHVRMGYRAPGLASVRDDFPFLAGLALLVFLTSPLAYTWLSRELRPLHDAVSELDTPDDSLEAREAAKQTPAAAIDSILERFHALQLAMAERAESMARERVALLASSKVVSHERQRLGALVDSLPDAVLGLDSGGLVAVANERALALLRRTREDLIGASPTIWCPSPELARSIARHAAATGRALRSEAVEFSLDELDERRFSASIVGIGEGDGLVVVIRDITQEHFQRKTQAEFLAHMAHELKAPLNVMGMYSESLLGPEGGEENFRIEACNVIRDEIDRLNGLINNLFSIGRIESGNATLERQRVRLLELLGDVFESVSREGGERSLEFELDLPESIAPVFADKHLLSVALRNLLTNAIKYNRDGGSVKLSAEEQENGLLIRVKDTGVGIREEDVDQVFEKFYRSEDESVRKVAGHGLGLALVKEIVALHGGEIRVESELGSGSEFQIYFDRAGAIFRGEA